MADHPVAFVDEAFIHPQQGGPGAYLFAAVLIDSDEVQRAITSAHHAARGSIYHSTTMYHRGHVGIIEDMLDTVERHAGWTVVAVQAPMDRNLEANRQATLERLLAYLNAQRVRDVILDTRADAADWQQVRIEGRRVPDIDRRDLRTYRRLVHDHVVSHRMRLIHADDRTQPALWMADAVAWSVRRALATDEPQWWLRISDVATVLDAQTGSELRLEHNRAAPPAGERDPHNKSQSAQAMLLSPSAYRNPPHEGGLLASLIDQAAIARAPQRDAGPGLEQELLSQVRRLAAQVGHLADEIRHLHDQPATHPPGIPKEPEYLHPTEGLSTPDRDPE